MLTRRSFLLGSGTLTLFALNSGCNPTTSSLRVSLLQGSIPPQLIQQFRQKIAQDNKIVIKPEAQLKDILTLLQKWQKSVNKPADSSEWQMPLINSGKSPVDDLVTLGDAWLEIAISEKLIQPLSLKQLSGWKNLPPSFAEIVQRDTKGKVSLTGQIWGAPYRWGTTLIAYRQDKFKTLGWEPQDWSDLWRPELKGRISMVDQPREIIGLTLKKMGYSYNTTNLDNIPQLSSELKSLQQQVKYYSSNHYLQPLILGDTWLAVGWSNDILSSLSNNRNLKAIVPLSGTSLWADLWVKPAMVNRDDTSVIEQWIDFCWQTQPAYLISLFTKGISPVILTQSSEKLPKELQENSLLIVNKSILEKSEFILPLAAELAQKYQDLWQEMRLS
ncbi:polyamine ABC transporter substrate-binding protein [Aphanothece hegewaldii CCALA 016]|uniref:Polyamine ABC transporter substrate-binding protein n=1 Tax=Aphanothece hegewaldii CCALA 016 TaxID=2107694 RepID=A0A2T1LYS9_9CHRO|nr:extracellular solute-binding protein [Aphanothece hegewaldii]PSF37558.1 polyamine ABC transporter substrate-binding protein [Aphanothece hegewaldii CCALA 016]